MIYNWYTGRDGCTNGIGSIISMSSRRQKLEIGDTAWFLWKLSELPGFKTDGRIYEADGHKYDGSYVCMEEAVVYAYCNLWAKIEARRIVKEEAKVHIP